jgi:acyl-coenzyme A thioesterase 13
MTIDSTNHAPSQDRPQDKDTADPSIRHEKVLALMHRLLAMSPIYGLILPSIQLVKVLPGSATLQLTLSPTHLNSKGGLHGAVSATIVDFVTGLAICASDLRESTGASVDMHLSFLSTAQAGDTVLIHSTAERVGGSLAFVSVRINKLLRDGTEKPVTLAQHTKYVRKQGA